MGEWVLSLSGWVLMFPGKGGWAVSGEGNEIVRWRKVG